jgi:hypothetical protein
VSKKFFAVNGKWLRTPQRPGYTSTTHYIVSADDAIGAARVAFDALKPAGGVWRNQRPPEVWLVREMLSPLSFNEEVGYLKVVGDYDEDMPTPFDAVEELFGNQVEVRL